MTTRISYMTKVWSGNRTTLLLVDAPVECFELDRAENRLKPGLHLPLAMSRGVLIIPTLLTRRDHSVLALLQQYFSHSWQLKAFFKTHDATPYILFHLLTASTWQHNFHFLEGRIKHTAFKDIRRPNTQINDQMHDLREQLSFLRAQVAATKKWLPPAVRTEVLSYQHLGYLPLPEDALQEISEKAEFLEKFLIDSFKLLISSTSVAEAELAAQQGRRNQRLTQLAFLYVPLSFVTGVFGMNLKEINGSPVPVWVAVIVLIVTALCTAGIFLLASHWENIFRRNKRASAKV